MPIARVAAGTDQQPIPYILSLTRRMKESDEETVTIKSDGAFSLRGGTRLFTPLSKLSTLGLAQRKAGVQSFFAG